MKRNYLTCVLVVGILILVASAALGQYTFRTAIAYTGASTDRGIAVNKNLGSPYYGYFYACDSGAKVVRIYRPDPPSDGTAATAYVDTGATLTGATLPMNVFVGSDDTVWVVDYSAKSIMTGSPGGGSLTTQFSTATNGRGLFVTGALGAAGTRVYVAECAYVASNWVSECEVFEYDGSSWSRIADLGNLGFQKAWNVTVDSGGNSYWVTGGSADPGGFVVKVKPDFTRDTSFTFTKPAWLGTSWTPSGIACVQDPSNLANPEYLYISACSPASCVRFDMSGNYIDGYGTTYGMSGSPPAGTWTGISLNNPGGNNNVWLTVDDKNNSYVTVRYDVSGTITNVAAKVHLAFAPNPPSNPSASNDIYGQVRLFWTPAVPVSPIDPVGGYRIYRSTDTNKPSTPYSQTPDDCPKWKDAAQGQTPGGPFYYWISAYNGGGESAAIGPVGPIAPTSSTAPAPRSKGVALSYPETGIGDIEVGNKAYVDTDYGIAEKFLTDRGITPTKIWDKDPAQLNIENDDIAGHTLLILPLNRDMTSYTAQCIRDYVKLNGGRLWTGYWNSLAYANFRSAGQFQLTDVYRVNYYGWDWSGSPAYLYRYLKPTTAPEAAVIFAGIPDGAIQPGINTISMLVDPYTDGTASVVGEWYGSDGITQPAKPTGLVVSYYEGEARCVYTSLLWWYRAANPVWGGTLSAIKLQENILTFFGIQFTPATWPGEGLGLAKNSYPDGHSIVVKDLVVTGTYKADAFNTSEFYVQAPDRSSGIKVVLPPTMPASLQDAVNSLEPGQTVDSLTGVLDSDYKTWTDSTGKQVYVWGDRKLDLLDDSFTPGAKGTLPKTLYIGNKDVAGSWGPNNYQNGITGATGLNNVGIYGRFAGKVTYVDPSNFYFYIDDGAGLTDGTFQADGLTPNVGVRVVVQTFGFVPPPVGKVVQVKGFSAIELVNRVLIGNDWVAVRAIRLYNAGDVKQEN